MYIGHFEIDYYYGKYCGSVEWTGSPPTRFFLPKKKKRTNCFVPFHPVWLIEEVSRTETLFSMPL